MKRGARLRAAGALAGAGAPLPPSPSPPPPRASLPSRRVRPPSLPPTPTRARVASPRGGFAEEAVLPPVLVKSPGSSAGPGGDLA